jgi:sarcosine oxidase subunit alpha
VPRAKGRAILGRRAMARLPDPRFAPDGLLLVDGRAIPARTGESVAEALVAAGRPLLSRSAKYHRPRGPFCLTGSCGSCLVRVDGEPNRRACRTPCRDGLRVETQNAWPDATHDLLGAIDLATPGGLDVHHLLTRPKALNDLLVSAARRLAGLGRFPDAPGEPHPPVAEERVEALVLGAGPAGLGAAEALARGGRRVLLGERDARAGGRLRAALDVPGDPTLDWAAEVAAAVRAAGGEVALGASAAGLWSGGGTPACLLVSEGPRPASRLVRAERIVVCTGGAARPPLFEDADVPGVFSGRALALALAEHGVVPGRRAAVLGDGPEAQAIAVRLRSAGMAAFPVPGEVRRARGRARVRALELADGTRVACDTVAQGASPGPAPELLRALGVGVDWDEDAGAYVPRVAADGTTPVPGLFAAGEAVRPVGAAEAAAWGRRAGAAALRGAAGTRAG